MAIQQAVRRIGTDTIESFLREDRALFIAVLRRDQYLIEHLRQLMDVAMHFREEVLVSCYTLEDLLPYFNERFGVCGTPTFLMVRGGEVLGTLLGKSSPSALAGFVQEHLKGFNSGTEPAGKAQGMKAGTPARRKKAARGIR
ncbi:MAG TPA: hypothetical protein PKM41_00430 [Deltaproteobacteria bacterium]|jgi:hypothetical protein|nr:hypothetical protein [Deltaproteobacteria bacterium]HOI05990.1 hypothetical protein [Deltaproteobacteria bacterium]